MGLSILASCFSLLLPVRPTVNSWEDFECLMFCVYDLFQYIIRWFPVRYSFAIHSNHRSISTVSNNRVQCIDLLGYFLVRMFVFCFCLNVLHFVNCIFTVAYVLLAHFVACLLGSLLYLLPRRAKALSDAFVWRLSLWRLSRTSGLSREQRGLGRLTLAQR